MCIRDRVQPAGMYFDGNPDPQLGKFERFEAVPNDPDALQSLLQEERRSREQLPPGDFKAVSYTHLDVYKRQVYEEPEKEEPLTPDGNATLVDDFGGNKQLITVTTKNGNYFYIQMCIRDRA